MTSSVDPMASIEERLDRRIGDLALAYGAPGVQIAVTDRHRTLLASTWSHRDVAARTPVTADTLFQIGSLGKSFTAACLMQLVEEGRVDLDEPVATYLPWFEVRSRFAPITLHHLLNHTAGIITGSDITSDSRFDVWALRETDAGWPPGERWHYSNVGYRVLGFVLEEIEGRAYADIVRSRILDPVGMASTEPAITNDIRDRLAVGYARAPDDRPLRYDAPLQPATWLETATGDGCIASTAEDMAAYLRVWLNRGQGDREGVVSESGFDRMATGGAFPVEEGWGYGYGLSTRTIEGRADLGHGGDMVGYASSMHGEPATGLGVVVLTNCLAYEDWPFMLCREVLGWVRATSSSGPPAPVAPRPDDLRVERAEEFAGRYEGDRGRLLVVAEGSGLFLEHGGDRIPLRRRPDDRFLVEHHDFARFLLGFERQDGAVIAAYHGPDRWTRGGAPPVQGAPPPQPDQDAFLGHYRSNNPWTTNFRVVRRGALLLLVYADGSEEPLTPLDPACFRIGDEDGSPERLRFDAIVEGRALRANLSGCDYYRTFTP
jgi:D-alanyl-D-alanine carboxypeptidase